MINTRKAFAAFWVGVGASSIPGWRGAWIYTIYTIYAIIC